MKVYVLTLVLLSLLSGGMLYLMKNSKYEKHLRYLCSLVLIVCLLLPLKSLLSFDVGTLIDGLTVDPQSVESGYTERLLKTAAQALEEELSAEIKNKTGLGDSDFSLFVTLAEKEKQISFSRLDCRLYSVLAVANREKIEKILSPYTDHPYFTEELR